MINEEEIKEAVEVCKTKISGKHIDILVNLANQVLAVKLPEKKEILPLTTDYRFGKSTQYALHMYNEALDLCRLAIAKDYVHRSKMLSQTELAMLIQENIVKNISIWDEGKESIDEFTLADAIIKAQEEKI